MEMIEDGNGKEFCQDLQEASDTRAYRTVDVSYQRRYPTCSPSTEIFLLMVSDVF